jgi:hypothetical protein
MAVRYQLILKDDAWIKAKILAEKEGLSLGKWLNKLIEELPEPEEDLNDVWGKESTDPSD